jgi:hypothetical protein
VVNQPLRFDSAVLRKATHKRIIDRGLKLPENGLGLADRVLNYWFNAKSPGVMTRGFCFSLRIDSLLLTDP